MAYIEVVTLVPHRTRPTTLQPHPPPPRQQPLSLQQHLPDIRHLFVVWPPQVVLADWRHIKIFEEAHRKQCIWIRQHTRLSSAPASVPLLPPRSHWTPGATLPLQVSTVLPNGHLQATAHRTSLRKRPRMSPGAPIGTQRTRPPSRLQTTRSPPRQHLPLPHTCRTHGSTDQQRLAVAKALQVWTNQVQPPTHHPTNVASSP